MVGGGCGGVGSGGVGWGRVGWGGVGWGGVGCTHFMHSRSLRTIDPRIPTMPGWSMLGITDQTDIARTKRHAPGGVR